jgi:integrase
MTKLETDVVAILEKLKPKLADATWQSRRRYFNQMIKLAKTMNIEEPCQELYDAFIADDNGSHNRHSLHVHCCKLMDAFACTNAKDEHGILFHESPMPKEETVQIFFQNYQFPIHNDVPIDFLIVKAGIEMKYLHLTNSSMGQYWHSWMDIRRSFHAANLCTYNEKTLQNYIHKNDHQYRNHSMETWKWKINRKAAYVLKEIAHTGCYHWKPIRKVISCNSSAMEDIRQQYIHLLQQMNLQKSSIELRDYVFRKTVEFARLETRTDLQSITPQKVQGIIIKFASICSSRSMSTILPILRSILKFFHTRGFLKTELSGAVMGGFVQRGSVSPYVSQGNQKILIARLEKECKRTRAILFLAIHLGLRDCDICHLTFQNIDWQTDTIHLVQKKTGESLVLPLLPEVGNALMDYILNERPKRNDSYPYIFLRKEAPYNKLTSAYTTCSRLFSTTGIKPENGNATGIHVFRHSLVHRLLLAKIPHPVIQKTLGHTSKESTQSYISMEESMLRMCALDLSIIGKITWNGGGVHDC